MILQLTGYCNKFKNNKYSRANSLATPSFSIPDFEFYELCTVYCECIPESYTCNYATLQFLFAISTI